MTNRKCDEPGCEARAIIGRGEEWMCGDHDRGRAIEKLAADLLDARVLLKDAMLAGAMLNETLNPLLDWDPRDRDKRRKQWQAVEDEIGKFLVEAQAGDETAACRVCHGIGETSYNPADGTPEVMQTCDACAGTGVDLAREEPRVTDP